MIVSYTVFWIVCVFLGAILLLPFFYFNFIRKVSQPKPFLVLLALLFPFIWNSPNIIQVTSCGSYTKEVLLWGKDSYTSGRHNYIVNNSDEILYLEPIFYGNVATDSKPQVCAPGQTIESKGSINYLFEDAPEKISVKNQKGAVRWILSCLPSYEEQRAITLEHYNKNLKENPNDIESLFYKGAILEEMGQTGAAVECFKQAAKIYDEGTGQSYFAAPSLGRLQQWNEAIEVYKKYLDTNEAENFAIYTNIGYCYIGLDNMKEARSYFEKAMELNSELIPIPLGLAIVNYKDGKIDEMKKNIDAVWGIQPELPHSFDCIQQLEYDWGGYFSPSEKQLLEKVFAAYTQTTI